MTELVDIQLLDLPIGLQGRAAAHAEALQREFALISHEHTDADVVPVRLRELIAQLTDRFGGVGDAAQEAIDRARNDGLDEVTVCYQVPPDVGEACQQLLDLLAEADDYCRSGELMTLATPDDQVAFREWFLGEFIRQVEGLGPRSWRSVSSAAASEPTAPTAEVSDADAEVDLEADPDEAPDEGWRVRSEGSVAHISFAGELDLVSAPYLRSLVARAADDDDLSALVIDLGEVTFLDSVGLSVLLTVRLRLVSDEVAVSVIPSPAVERVFQLAGVSELFTA